MFFLLYHLAENMNARAKGAREQTSPHFLEITQSIPVGILLARVHALIGIQKN
jgi:hypothetical protein